MPNRIRLPFLLTILALIITVTVTILALNITPAGARGSFGDQTSANLHYWALSLIETGSKITEIAAAPDGGIIAAGCSDCDLAESQNWLIRFRPDGSIAWQRSFGYRFITIVQAGDGDFLLSTINSGSISNHEAELIRIDADGQIVWHKQYGSGRFDDILDIKPVASGGFITAGISLLSSTPVEGKGSIWIMRLRDDGSVIWKKNYGNCCDGWAYEVVPTRDNGFIVAGTDNGVAYLLKLRVDGSVAWHKLYGDSDGYTASVIQTQDGGFAFGGYNNFSKDNTNYQVPWVVKVNAGGDIVWQKLYHTESCCSCYYARAYAIRTTSDGNLLVYSGSECGDTWIMKLAGPDGTVLWQKAYKGTPSWLPNLVQAGSFLAIAMQADDQGNLLRLDGKGEIDNCPLVSQGDLVTSTTSILAQASSLTVMESPAVQTDITAPVTTDTDLSPGFLCQHAIHLENTFYLPQCAKQRP